MLTGKQKSKILLGLLGDDAQSVLGLLTPESANILTSDVDSAPELDQKELNAFVQETLLEVENIKIDSDSLSSEDEFSLDNVDEDASSEDTSDTDSSFLEEPSLEKKGEFEESSLLEEQAEEKEVEQSLPVGIRRPDEIALLLSEQKSQIIAFFLFKLDNDFLKKKILDSLPKDIKKHVDDIDIEAMPLSDVVYQKLYDRIVKKPESVETE